MKTVSIEYSHIYTNEKIGVEHEVSVRELDKIQEESESLVVLVDDYSFPDPTFDYVDFSQWLSSKGHTPNIVFRESQLIPLCDEVLREVPEGVLKDSLTDYIKAKKYPCSLFIASWYLLRLGKLAHPLFPESEYAQRLINILPESFKSFEDKGFDIIRATKYRDLVENIENRYIEGRLIA